MSHKNFPKNFLEKQISFLISDIYVFDLPEGPKKGRKILRYSQGFDPFLDWLDIKQVRIRIQEFLIEQNILQCE